LLGKLTGTLGVDNSDDWENEQAFTNLRDQPVSDFTGESKSTVDKTVIVSKSAAIPVFRSYYQVPRCPPDEGAEIPIGAACDGERLLVLNDRLVPLRAW
jgi:hypothetical protein